MIETDPLVAASPAGGAAPPPDKPRLGGYRPEELRLVLSGDTRDRYFFARELHAKRGNKAAKGIGWGGASAGAVAAILAMLATLDTALLIPGLDLVLPGPLVAGLAGLGLGAVVGGIAGAVVGWRIPEARIQESDASPHGGEILLSIRPRDPDDNRWLQHEWNRHTGLSV